MGKNLQYLILLNFTINIAPVFKDMVVSSKDKVLHWYKMHQAEKKYQNNLWRRTEISRYSRKLSSALSRPEAIMFCRNFYKELQWCRENNLDATVLPENKRFYEIIKEHDLLHRKR